MTVFKKQTTKKNSTGRLPENADAIYQKVKLIGNPMQMIKSRFRQLMGNCRLSEF